MAFHYEWATVRGARTLLMKVAKVVEVYRDPVNAELSVNAEPEVDALWSNPTDSKRMLLLIPGNPGCINYYQEFALALWRSLGGTVPVWGISHAGHVFHDKLKQETFDGNAYPTLQFQVDHKRWFLDHYVPPHVEHITIIGHSIGSYIALQMAKQSKDPRINHVIGLFPTIERMALTPHGRIYTPVFKYMNCLT
ncbi:hypothetical protein RvY_15854 [Ramazzottius varieornatus]|uniref:Lipid droplet-associated hydrolase n=1 Tax=Ramazzottius varieornatus TaxID=947166 RepID=A0A1D1VXU7_RAMVA|nr:hypothetical protein RvY_15854 [Ramazzottius varieornatus]